MAGAILEPESAARIAELFKTPVRKFPSTKFRRRLLRVGFAGYGAMEGLMR